MAIQLEPATYFSYTDSGRYSLKRSIDSLGQIILGVVLLFGVTTTLWAQETTEDLIDRGRYLSKISGCNDCHTAGYLLAEGKIPESLWLTGDKLGWFGPWGTTYAPNLRLSLEELSEKEWLIFARNLRTRPPMPWFALNEMDESDLKAIYQFIRQLGPAGEPAPSYLPPGKEPPPPFVTFPAPPE